MAEPHDSLYFVSGDESDREEMRAVAMACATLGIPMRQRSFTDRAGIGRDGKKYRRLTWYLHEKSPDGRWVTGELRAKWQSETFRAENPEHPITILWQHWDNMRRAVEHEKQCEEIQIRRGNKVITVPKSWPRERIEEAMKKLTDKKNEC